jgi:hypothetical protein
MGCDFYTFYKICIEYIKNDTNEVVDHMLDETKERHDWNECERDEDFEEINDFFDRQNEERREQIDYLLEQYKTTQIYKDKTWLCIPSAKEKYQYILKKYGISENTVVKIWRQGDFMVR